MFSHTSGDTIARKHPIPVRFIGVGKGTDDLQAFDARAFVKMLSP